MDITVITGNPNKLVELQAIFPEHLHLKSRELNLEEIQGEGEPRNIIEDKLRRAYEIIGAPVIAEDVSAELSCLNGLPGPFIKFFEQKLGKGALWELAKHHEDRSATIRCMMGYYAGKEMIVVEGIVQGTVVPPRGERGFGFDFVIVPEGSSKTYAEMSPDEKNKVSHRARAIQLLVEHLT